MFVILFVVIAASIVLMLEAGGLLGQGYNEAPNPHRSTTGVIIFGFCTLQAALLCTIIFQKEIKLFPAAIAVLIFCPTALVFGPNDLNAVLTEKYFKIDEMIRLPLAVGPAVIMMLPWFIKRMKWPAKTPGHLAISISCIAGALLQTIYHIVLVSPGIDIAHDNFENAVAIIERSASPQEIERLIELGAVPLMPIDPSSYEEDMQVLNMYDPASSVRRVASILEDAPHAFFMWPLQGIRSNDRSYMIYDGRALDTEAQPRLWALPNEAFLAPRLAGSTGYFYLTALGAITWLGGALYVHWAHTRPGRRRQKN